MPTKSTRLRLSRTSRASASSLVLAAALAALTTPAFAQDSRTTQEIVVTAQRENATHVGNGGSAGVLGDKAAEDLPFNVRSFDETLILNQQPRSLGEVLENDPTVRTTYGYGNAAESFIIRGFELYGDDVGLNGLYGITPRQLIAPELFEQVQVLNGSSAFLNGAAPGGSGLGGSVNLLLKHAGDQDLNRATLGYTSDAHFGGSFDVSRRFGNFGIRINGNYQDGQTGIDREDRKTQVLGVGLDWDSGPVRMSLDVAYQKVRVDHLRPKLTLSTSELPEIPSASYNFAQDYTYTDLRDVFGVFNFEYDFAPNATMWVKAGARDGSEEGIYGGFNLYDAQTGDGYLTALYVPRTDNNEAVETGARVTLGSAITQEIVIGANASWQVNRNAYDFRYGTDFTGVASNYYDAVQIDLPDSVYVGGDLDDPYPISKINTFSTFASDTVGFWDDRILVTGGLRLQKLETKSYSAFGGELTGTQELNKITPVAGLVVKPVAGLSLYANRIESLQQGPTAGFGASNFGEVFPPYVSTQYEVGGKLQIGAMFASLAWYQIDKPYGYTDVDTLVYAIAGTQRNQGVEFTLNGEILPGLRLISGVSHVDAKLLESTDPSAGTTPKGVPDWTANANVEWDTPLPGFTLTGRVTYTGKQWVDVANTFKLPSWTIFNAGARYVFAAGEVPVTLRFNVDNIADKAYWASAYDSFSSAVLQGQPRTFKASISADF
ncbi:TonB-dependent receptor [Novosphingobium mangrovi (ex Hu et al. 2023)]|uniref:TonB-dependent receptor n=1 Tax=Novosphingobium mangrovi (ex Hu et al. 2023) TaxID=2930094 RepID=A0ABT0ABH0_9SPHN|nr:TonB-dependent receptor [Novosphingobium mangrovi (ex Hu et al. 2023)]MCJ1960530.1 TonB-dependent receptor [Novosphingobium mangrovi (ex Hu et al. 2023)]